MPEELNPNAAPSGDTPPPQEPVSEPAAEAAGAETATESEPGEEGEQERPRGHNLQRRIDRLTQARYRAEAEARVLREELERTRVRESAPTRQAADEDAEPVETDFTDFKVYTKALAAWAAKQATREEAQRQSASWQQAQAQSQHKALHQQYSHRANAFMESTPDYLDAVSSCQIKLYNVAETAIKESDVGPQIVYHLATNPKDAAAIEAMSPAGQARFIGKLEAKFSSSAPGQKTASSAPPPIPKVGGSSSVPAFDQATAKEGHPGWKAWRKQRDKEEAERRYA